MLPYQALVNLTFCSVHLGFNTIDTFKSFVERATCKFGNFQLQASSFPADFDSKITKIAKSIILQLPSLLGRKKLKNMYGTIYANNMNNSPEELKRLAASWGNGHVRGHPSPLFGVCSTSTVEGDNNGLL
ncbi:Hypothetical protein PHPALM_3977 [Phytophthora palmivora]|uniref:Uncharacterized protein n=1 Tax=Phytophthora palmivora TaxID=4796 RepID=A0A2P4YKZ8_9STRA|nr:Hypothetical protein PHPALM_3977 [Phytophthora palmivora]